MDNAIGYRTLFNFIVEGKNNIDNQELDSLYETLLNGNFKIKQDKIGTVYFYGAKTTIKDMNASEYSVGSILKVLNVLFRYAHSEYLIKGKDSKVLVKVPVYKRKGKFVQKEGNYCNSKLLSDYIFITTTVLGFDNISEDNKPDGSSVGYVIEKNKIRKNKEMLGMLLFIIKERDNLIKSYGRDTVNDILLVISSYFIGK